jgi:SWI/SNF-related matrix-associated actin-dependent regulator 1 of chromatin subfamily A
MTYQDFKCGHTQLALEPSPSDFKDFTSLSGQKPYKFQVEGATWALKSNGRFLIMDEMGLGKTIQFLMVAQALERTRFLVVCKASLEIQWAKQTYNWCNESLVQIIKAENEFIMPGCKGFVISYDLLWRFKDIPAFIKRLGVDLIGLDEVQHLKNTDSKRTNGVRIACKEVTYIGALSGTPIMNHAGEFFPILNILHPEKFYNMAKFRQVYLESYWNGYTFKDGGLKDYRHFHEVTKDFIIRRTRSEVMPDLPAVTRDFQFTELGGQVEAEYIRELKEFQTYMNTSQDTGGERQSNILSYLTRMRHITGKAKIQPVLDFMEDFLEETNRKIVIFVHHKDVHSGIVNGLQELQVYKKGKEILSFVSELSREERDDVVQKFKLPQNRILVASTLATGEGVDGLQCASDCIIVERQWNPAKEEQVEGRFIRIGQGAQKVTATYPTAVGTVDEFFAEIVERKRGISANTLDGKEYKWDESSIMTELAEILASSGGHRWGF